MKKLFKKFVLFVCGPSESRFDADWKNKGFKVKSVTFELESGEVRKLDVDADDWFKMIYRTDVVKKDYSKFCWKIYK